MLYWLPVSSFHSFQWEVYWVSSEKVFQLLVISFPSFQGKAFSSIQREALPSFSEQICWPTLRSFANFQLIFSQLLGSRFSSFKREALSSFFGFQWGTFPNFSAKLSVLQKRSFPSFQSEVLPELPMRSCYRFRLSASKEKLFQLKEFFQSLNNSAHRLPGFREKYFFRNGKKLSQLLVVVFPVSSEKLPHFLKKKLFLLFRYSRRDFHSTMWGNFSDSIFRIQRKFMLILNII